MVLLRKAPNRELFYTRVCVDVHGGDRLKLAEVARVEAVALHLKHQLWLLEDKSSIALTSLARRLFTPQETVNHIDINQPLSLK